MSFTYSGNPASTPRDWVRFKLGDVKRGKASLTDGELDFLISEATPAGQTATTSPATKVHAAIAAAREMATRYSGFSASSKTVGNVSLSYEHAATADRFRDLAEQLKTLLPPEQVSGGFTGALMAPARPSIFRVGMGDNFLA